jgi:hypothetical protein
VILFYLTTGPEESTVRDKATESAVLVGDSLSTESFQDQYADMISRLATKEWFTSRMSAASLIASSFSRFNEQQQVCACVIWRLSTLVLRKNIATL